MRKETAETHLGKKINNTLVLVPAYSDSSGRPDLRHGGMHLRRALLTIEMESLDMNHCRTRTLEQTHERHRLVWTSTSSFENPLRDIDAFGRVSAAEAVVSR